MNFERRSIENAVYFFREDLGRGDLKKIPPGVRRRLHESGVISRKSRKRNKLVLTPFGKRILNEAKKLSEIEELSANVSEKGCPY